LTDTTPLQHCLQLRSVLSKPVAGFPEPLRLWLLAGFVAAMDEGVSLETGLGLKGAGIRKLKTLRRMAYRDTLIAEAAALVDGRDAAALAAEISRFETRKWPAWRQLAVAPSHATPIERILFDVFRSGLLVPSSARQIDRILTSTPLISCQENCATIESPALKEPKR